MPIEIKVPRLGWSMEEGTFIEWFKQEGQTVRAGEPLFAIEGDKAIQEVEAIGSGILRILPTAPENGDTVKVGTMLAVLVGADETDLANQPLQITEEASVERPPPERRKSWWDSHGVSLDKAMDPIASDAGSVTPGARVEPLTERDPLQSSRARISPRAIRVAKELGVDWRTIPGTGRSGRVRERDVRHAAARSRTPPPPRRPSRRSAETQNAPDEGRVHSSFRRTIAARMLEGSQSTAPVTLTTSADATNLASLRAQFKATVQSPGEVIPGYTDILLKLVARALQEHEALNRLWIDDQIIAPDGIHIAIAVDTPAGLLAPVVRDVPSLGLREIAAQTQGLKVRAHAAQLTPQDLQGGTFTVSNLGAFGIDAFTPIINVPQCAILGLGRIARLPAVVGDQIVPRDTITLSLTFDHRIVDGAPAARFLAALRTAIENPGPWLVF
jgi:pyruvate dehydrogenase E2 component (dihydrolipoamide acetyltransferase)